MRRTLVSNVRRLLLIGTENRYGKRVMAGVHAYCREHGVWEYHLEEDRGAETITRSKFAIRQWKAHGIIGQIQSPSLEQFIAQSGVPAVNFSGSNPSTLPSVVADSTAIGRLVARHFIENGSRSFAFCALTNEPSAQLRCKGFVGELADAGLACEIFVDQFSGRREKDWVKNRRRMDEWLPLLKKPVSIMCIHDPRGQEVTWTCRRLGLRVPDDVALVAVGNDDILCQMCNPPLSSVDADPERIGYESAELLHGLMRGRRPPDGPVLVPPRRLEARQSSDIIAIDDPDIAAAVRFIRDHAAGVIDVGDVLKQVSISRRALERGFRQILDRTPKEEILRVRMERAKSLLSETVLPVSVVATRCGFSGQEKFSAMFHRKCGMTPTAYRRRSQLDGGRLPDS